MLNRLREGRCERANDEWTEVWGEEEERGGVEKEERGGSHEGIIRGGASTPRPDHPKHTTTTPGLTLTVLNQYTAQPIFHKVFRVDKYWAHWSDLKWHLDRVSGGRLVVVAVSVTGIIGLRHAAHTMVALGSVLATHLPPSAHWTWIFVKGGRTISETAITHAQLPHHAHTIIPLSDIPYPVVSCANQSVMGKLCDKMAQDSLQRWQYCDSHGAMGGLCDEVAPDPLPLPTPPPITHNTTLATVPVIVTAGKRHQYLYHTLTTLLTTPGAIHHNVHVVLGDAPSSTTKLLHLLNLNFTSLPVEGHHNYKLFHYYRSVYNFIATSFPQAPAVILLDEDVEVSPDFFSYFSQTLWLLNSDPTLYCINAHSATGFTKYSYQPQRIFRGSVQVQWGYAVTLHFIREALNVWPLDNNINIVIYDFWLYQVVRRGRECVFPEISRTLHYYGSGTNAGVYIAEKAFLDKPLLRNGNVKLTSVDRLVLPKWKQDLSYNISKATPLTGHPCTQDFLPKLPTKRNYVFYYRLDKLEESQGPDMTQLFHLHECLGAWSVSEQGQHEGVSILPFTPHNQLYLVGVPYSYYSHLKPPNLHLWDINTIPEKEFRAIEDISIGSHMITPANMNITLENLLHILFIH